MPQKDVNRIIASSFLNINPGFLLTKLSVNFLLQCKCGQGALFESDVDVLSSNSQVKAPLTSKMIARIL
jgi:hypothetical protein